jgi:heme/copper-type cytochrome/quinol oxidase subunit 2
MHVIALLIVLIIALLFGLSTISQSYATAQQAQAAIEASKATQIANAGNLVVLVALLVSIVLVAVTAFVIIVLLLRKHQRALRQLGTNRDMQHSAQLQPDANSMLSAALALLTYRILQEQAERDAEQMHQLNLDSIEMTETAHNFDTPDNFWMM